MKTLNWTKTGTLCLTLVLSLASGFAASQALAGTGNGGGTNGPILDGEAIPVKLDQGISLGKLKRAILTCLVTGDEKQGLVSVFDRVAKQIYGKFDGKLTGASAYISNEAKNTFQLSGGKTHQLENTAHNMIVWQHPYIFGMGTPITMYPAGVISFGVTIADDKTARGTSRGYSLITDQPFPMVTWQKVEKEPEFDELGGQDVDQTIVSGIHIEKPKDFVSNIVLVNANSRRATKVTAPAQEYVECLYSEIQK